MMTDSNSERHAFIHQNPAALASGWRQFVSEFPTDADCIDELYRRAALIECRYCQGREFDKKRGHRMLRCRACDRKTSLTAATLFHGVTRFQAWLGAIWMMEHGFVLNAFKLHKFAGVAYDTAYKILKKLSLVIESCMEGEAIPSAPFAAILSRRSRETPARLHPSCEEGALEKKLPNTDKTAPDSAQEKICDWIQSSSAGKLSAMDKEVFGCLSDQPEHVDNLCARLKVAAGELSAALITLELEGLAVRMAGDRYIRAPVTGIEQKGSAGQASEQQESLVASFINFIRSHFQGISRKYLQIYLAVHWFYCDEERWAYGSLLSACLEFRHIGYGEILDFVSPPLVKVCL